MSNEALIISAHWLVDIPAAVFVVGKVEAWGWISFVELIKVCAIFAFLMNSIQAGSTLRCFSMQKQFKKILKIDEF